jgi:hypothetical protein
VSRHRLSNLLRLSPRDSKTRWLDSGGRQTYFARNEEAPVRAALRIMTVIVIAGALAPGFALSAGTVDPDWPCQQVKVTSFPLASVWAGPDLDLNAQSRRSESDVAELAAKMSQRRVPAEEVASAIAEFKTKAGPDANAKLLGAFAAAFEDLTQQRSKILQGLERFGYQQRAMADQIRAENESLQKAVDANKGEPSASDAEIQRRLDWDMRVFDDRRQTIRYVCELPAEIERRIGVIAQAVQQAL